jgi:tetratricopeptide (TPR) repeat protein
MPRLDSSNVVHVAITDHRIMRKPDAGGAKAKALGPGRTPLVPYRSGPHAPAAVERDRDFAIALADECVRSGAPAGLWQAVETQLDRVSDMWPADSQVWIARSRVYGARGNGRRAIDAANTAVELVPESEVALIQLAGAAMAADDFATAIHAAGTLIALNPSSADHRQTRATAYFSLNDWAQAESDCRAALAIQPVRPNARFMLAVCLHQRGDAAGGRRELDLAIKLTPSPEMRDKLSRWYAELTVKSKDAGR